MIAQVISYSYSVWKSRSKKVHEVLEEERIVKETQEMNVAITTAYRQLLREVRSRERFLLRLSLSEVLELQLESKKDWLDFVNVVSIEEYTESTLK